MEEDAGADEEAEEEDLQDEAGYDEGFAEVLGGGFGHHGTASSLHEEREDVADDEDLGEPIRAYRRHAFTIGKEDDAAEDHVDTGCEEGRWE